MGGADWRSLQWRCLERTEEHEIGGDTPIMYTTEKGSAGC
jgi:hypothetical protein